MDERLRFLARVLEGDRGLPRLRYLPDDGVGAGSDDILPGEVGGLYLGGWPVVVVDSKGEHVYR